MLLTMATWERFLSLSLSFVYVLNSIYVSACNNASLDIDDIITTPHGTSLTCNILANMLLNLGDRSMGNLENTYFYP